MKIWSAEVQNKFQVIFCLEWTPTLIVNKSYFCVWRSFTSIPFWFRISRGKTKEFEERLRHRIGNLYQWNNSPYKRHLDEPRWPFLPSPGSWWIPGHLPRTSPVSIVPETPRNSPKKTQNIYINSQLSINSIFSFIIRIPYYAVK